MSTVRYASVEDIDDFREVVCQSVLALCKEHYSTGQLQSLLGQYPGRLTYEKWLQDRVLLVADDGGNIIGFAQYHPANASIEAVHVLPAYANRGIGKKLVEKIETIARERGVAKITLGSSLNAAGFYEKCGYHELDHASYQCNDGVVLEVVNFEKPLMP